MSKFMSLSFVAVLVAGCGGDGGNGEELVGTWTGAWGFFSASITFDADGTVDVLSDGEVASGTWEADGERLTLEGLPFDARRVTSGYVVHEDLFMFTALVPDGDVDGIIGMWHGASTADDFTRETTLELASGGTGHITFDGEVPGVMVDTDLTWELDGTILRMGWRNTDNSSTERLSFVIPDVAIGSTLMGRAEPSP